jgi:hypothetical protein
MLSKSKLSIASIGRENDAMYINGTTSLINCELKDLADVMASSRLIAGPSSGPIHFASLCGLPQVVWSESKNRIKYLKYWNPFNVKVSFYDEEQWNPSVKNIYRLIMEMIK